MPFLPFPDPPPVPVSASYDGVRGEWSVLFDQPLADAVLDAGNWALLETLFPHAVASAEVDGDRVIGTAASGLNISAIRYEPPPFDVTSVQGAEVMGFVLPV